MKKISARAPVRTATKPNLKLVPAQTRADHVPGTKDCPVFMTLSLIANKWSISILYQLMQENGHTMRFNALKKALSTITQRELTKHLRQFEESGIVERTVYPESPPRVEYTLTALGNSLCKPIEALSHWAEEHGNKVQSKRNEFIRKKTLELARQ